MMSLGKVVLFTFWLVLLFVAGVLFGEAVMGASVTTPVTFTSSVNLSVSNSSLTVTAPSSTNVYALSNVTVSYSVPVSFSENISLFNVTVDLNESEQCFAFINSTLVNNTAEFERIVREQLVPSQKQYADLVSQKAEFEGRCDDEKNILRNEAVDWRVQLNATRTNYEAVVQRQGDELLKVRGEKRTYYYWNLGLIFFCVLLFVAFAKNISYRTLWDEVANMRGRRQQGGFQSPPQQEVKNE